MPYKRSWRTLLSQWLIGAPNHQCGKKIKGSQVTDVRNNPAAGSAG